MSIAPGYVHISVRNANKVSRTGIPGFPQHAAHHPSRQMDSQRQSVLRELPTSAASQLTATSTLVAGSASGVGASSVGQDNVAHGFVLYVGIDEEVAAANGTSLAKLAQDIRAYTQSLVPQAQSYAAVAIAAADTPGSSLDVVRSTFGDPTVGPRQRVELRVNNAQEPRPAGVLIDLARREVHLDGDTLNLTFKEFELLNYLVENGARTVGREELLDGLWRHADDVPNERTIDVHIRRLRSKLGRLANTVRTVRGEGYRFYEHPEVVVWAAPEYLI